MFDIFFQCDSCGKQQVISVAGTQAQLSCPDCASKHAVPQIAIVQNCPNCNRVVKIDPTLKGEVLHCHGCNKSILLPMRRGDRIICLCKRCDKSIEIPVAEAGKLLACPKCEGWITGPELKDVVDGLLASQTTGNPKSGFVPTAANLKTEKKLIATVGTVLSEKATFTSAPTEVRRTKTPPDSAQALLQNLEAEASHLASNNCFFLASFVLKYYEGEYAEETLVTRLELASRYFDAAIKHDA